MAMFLQQELSNKFEKLEVSKSDLQKAVNVMENKIKKFERYEEKMVHAVVKKIPNENIEGFSSSLARKLKLTSDQAEMLKDTLEPITYAGELAEIVYEVKVDIDELRSLYGYFAACQDPGKESFSIAYAFHKLDFKVAPKWRKLAVIPGRFCTWEIGRKERVHLDTEDIDSIKDVIMRHRCLETLKKEGVINRITYID